LELDSEKIIKFLKERGIKVTPQRIAIAKAITHLNHPTAEEICKYLEKSHPYIGLATVYRTIKLFAKQGIVRELSFSNKGTRYDINVKPHINLVCVNCGQIKDIDSIELESLIKDFMDNGYQVIGFRFEIDIYCESCRARRRRHRNRVV